MDDVEQSIINFPKQCQQAWEETGQLNLRPVLVENVNLVGMGASAYGYYVVKALFEGTLKVPLLLVNDYNLPAFADEKTLVVISSFSGNTEESLSVLEKALVKHCQVVVISSGGKLAQITQAQNVPGYIFQNLWNPSGQPRLACGYTVFSFLGILKKYGLLNLVDSEVKESISFLEEEYDSLEDDTETETLLEKMTNRQILILAGEHLAGNAHIFRNQLNETSKVFSVYSLIPETNHHLLEGLGHPKSNKDNIQLVSLHSNFYQPRIKKRFSLTENISVQNGIDFSIIKAKGDTRLKEALWMILYSSFLSYRLALINGEDPKKIEWVDYFKKQLAAQDD